MIDVNSIAAWAIASAGGDAAAHRRAREVALAGIDVNEALVQCRGLASRRQLETKLID